MEKSQDALGKEIKLVLDQVDKAQTRANDLAITAGRLLLEAKAKVVTEGTRWTDFLKGHKLDERRSQEVMRIAKGGVTVEEMKEDHAQRQAKYRSVTKPVVHETASRDAVSHTPAAKIVVPQSVVTSVKKEEVKEVATSDLWDTDYRTVRLKADLQQVRNKINSLTEEIDDMKYAFRVKKVMLNILSDQDPDSLQ